MDNASFLATSATTHDLFQRAYQWIEALLSPRWVHYVEPKASSTGDSLYRVLDWGAGCDYIIEDSSSTRIYGLSTRFQVAEPPPGAFTIRHWRETGTPTEYQKWVNALDDPRCIRPAYHIQGFFNSAETELLELGIAPIEAIIGMIRHSLCTERQARDAKGLNKFYIVSMDDMVKLDLPVSLLRFRSGELVEEITRHWYPYQETIFKEVHDTDENPL
jgi:hypothetical protein